MRVPIRRFSSTDSRHAEIRHAVHNSWWRFHPRRIVQEAHRRHLGLALHPSSVRVSYFTVQAISADRDVDSSRWIYDDKGKLRVPMRSDPVRRSIAERARGIDESAIKLTKLEEVLNNGGFGTNEYNVQHLTLES